MRKNEEVIDISDPTISSFQIDGPIKLFQTPGPGFVFIDDHAVTYSVGYDPILVKSEQIGKNTLYFNNRGNVVQVDLPRPVMYRKEDLGLQDQRLDHLRTALRKAHVRAIIIRGEGDEHLTFDQNGLLNESSIMNQISEKR